MLIFHLAKSFGKANGLVDLREFILPKLVENLNLFIIEPFWHLTIKNLIPPCII